LPTGLDDKSDHSLIVEVYPNPGNNIFNVSFMNSGDIKTGKEVQVQFVDQIGRVMTSTVWKIKSGANNFRVDASGFAAGTYYLNIAGEGLKGTTKITKL
jgi:hypothetical protein